MELLIAPSSLNEAIHSFILLDCGDELAYSLPGALHLDWRGDPGRVLAYMEQLGVGKEEAIVCFTKWGLEDAARVWWVLTQHGFTQVRVLNGGAKSWSRLGLKMASSPRLLPEVLSKPIESEFMLVCVQDAPANATTLDTTQDSLKFMPLLTKDGGLVEPQEIKAKLAYLSPAQSLVVTGDLVGTLILALTIAGYTKLYCCIWSLTAKVDSVCREFQSNSTDMFEVVEIAPQRLSYASTASRTRMQTVKKREEEADQEKCMSCGIF